MIVRLADEIAQRHHDVEDGLESKIIDDIELLGVLKDNFNTFLTNGEKKQIEQIFKEKEKEYYIPQLSKLIVNFYANNLIGETIVTLKKLKEKYSIINELDFNNKKSLIYEKEDIFNIVCFNADFCNKDDKFKKYLKSRILNSYKAQSIDGKSNYIIRQLFKALITNPQQLPDKTIITLFQNYLTCEEMNSYISGYKSPKEIAGQLRNRLSTEHNHSNNNSYKIVLLRTICDYIQGMTDNYATKQYSILYGTKPNWN